MKNVITFSNKKEQTFNKEIDENPNILSQINTGIFLPTFIKSFEKLENSKKEEAIQLIWDEKYPHLMEFMKQFELNGNFRQDYFELPR